MLEVISIENNKDSENSNNMLWKNLLIESYNAYRKLNDFRYDIESKNNLEEFWKLIESDVVHLVLKQNKFIGFFINTEHRANKEVSFKVFSHPLACPMSIRSITKAALFRAFMMFIEDPSLTELEFNTWHPSLATAVKRFVPDLEVTLINSKAIVCYKKISSKDLRSFSNTLLKYLDNTQQLKKNHYKILY